VTAGGGAVAVVVPSADVIEDVLDKAVLDATSTVSVVGDLLHEDEELV